MMSLRSVKNNCNNYYSGYSGLSVGEGEEEDGWRRVQEWKRMTRGWREDEEGEWKVRRERGKAR